MIFWHLGLTVLIVFLALGRRRIDYRVVMLGALLPDLIDKPIGRILFEDTLQTSRVFAHTFLFPILILLAVMLFMRGETARRWFILPIASMLHLALDGMWADPVTLFWPLFGLTFPPMPHDGYWLDALLRPFTDLGTGLRELAGMAALLYLGHAYGLNHREAFRHFLRDGRLREQRDPAGAQGS